MTIEILIDACEAMIERTVQAPDATDAPTAAALLADLQNAGLAITEHGGHLRSLTMLGITVGGSGAHELLNAWLLAARAERRAAA